MEEASAPAQLKEELLKCRAEHKLNNIQRSDGLPLMPIRQLRGEGPAYKAPLEGVAPGP
jgi:hypothetical protein